MFKKFNLFLKVMELNAVNVKLNVEFSTHTKEKSNTRLKQKCI